RKDRPVEGYISQIAGVPIDIGEKEARSFGTTAKLTGIKIYRVQVKPRKYEEWMKPGMNADIKLFSETEFKHQAVPVKYLQIRDGKNYLAVNGVYREVKGFVNQGWFMIESEDFSSRSVSLSGRFVEDVKEESDKASGRFTASGEVIPLKSTPVVVPDILGESKIFWLKEEESEVKKGDVLIKMGTQEIDQEIANVETKKATLLNTVNTLKKSAELKRRETTFKIARAKNSLEIARLEKELAEKGLDYKNAVSARLSYLKAKIDYENSVSQLTRLRAKNQEFISKSEIERAEREEKRKKLQLELSEIEFRLAKVGATRVEKSQADLAYHTQKVEYENYLNEKSWDQEEREIELKKSELRLSEVEFDLKNRYQKKKNLVMTAPADGIIRYGKVWDNGVIDKITIGTGLRERMTAMTIPNLDRLFIKVEVPEKYYSQVEKGLDVEIRIPSISETVFHGRVESINYIFKSVARRDSQIGIYSSQEPLGETVFIVNVALDKKGQKIKPGVIADVYFPFKRF
ncbi:MAG: HlyD family secretion protein, partial [Lentisphaeraceae bacterium]|nr:HlyD family secretion protein [Lentisphaeraceae bacterium]